MGNSVSINASSSITSFYHKHPLLTIALPLIALIGFIYYRVRAEIAKNDTQYENACNKNIADHRLKNAGAAALSITDTKKRDELLEKVSLAFLKQSDDVNASSFAGKITDLDKRNLLLTHWKK